jgi:hypothetical protein
MTKQMRSIIEIEITEIVIFFYVLIWELNRLPSQLLFCVIIIFNYVPIKQMVFVSNGGKLKHYTVPNGLLFQHLLRPGFHLNAWRCRLYGDIKNCLGQRFVMDWKTSVLTYFVCSIHWRMSLTTSFTSSVRTIGLPPPFFESQSLFRETHQHNL